MSTTTEGRRRAGLAKMNLTTTRLMTAKTWEAGVMPRPYRMVQRARETDATRRRVLTAATELLASEDGRRFTVEEVARRADVARQTVYYQFGSKTGLVGALCDFLAARGGMEALPDALIMDHPLRSLEQIIEIFGRFWQADRAATRRLRALAALDAEVGDEISARNDRRRAVLRVALERQAARTGTPRPDQLRGVLDILVMLTSFEAFDTLAGERPITEATPAITRLAALALIPDQAADQSVPAS